MTVVTDQTLLQFTISGYMLQDVPRGSSLHGSCMSRVDRPPTLLRLTLLIHVARRAPRFLSTRELYVSTGRLHCGGSYSRYM